MSNKKMNLGFCEIYYKKDDKSIDEGIRLIKMAFEYNKEFFKSSKVQKFKIIIVYSRKELDNLRGRKTSKWVSAFAKKTKIFIFSLSVFEKETCWGEKDFYPTLVHEINHIFFTILTKKIYEPIWLCEGLATHLQRDEKEPKRKTKIFYTILNKNFNYKIPRYNMYHLFVYYLIKKYGKDKFRKFFRMYAKNSDINKSLLITYNKQIKELIKDANKA